MREHNGRKTLERYTDVETDSSIFGTIGADFEAEGTVRKAEIGQASCRVFSLREAVDFARIWLNARD